MMAEKELEDLWLQKIPHMLRWVQLLVLLDFSSKLVVVVGLGCQFRENDELQHYLFFNLFKSGQTQRVFVITVVYFL